MRQIAKTLIRGIDREAWVRFFVALFGLALAFAAAIFSTVTRQSGNVWATAVLASSALFLAAWVGFTTVPYLARRVAFANVREALDYQVTREGLIYLAFVLIIGVAALNTGNNLLFIIVSAMLAAILISGMSSAAVLRSVLLDVSLPEHVFALTPITGRFLLRNRRRFLPAFSIAVVPPEAKKMSVHWRVRRSTFAFPPKARPERRWFQLPDWALMRERVANSKSGILEMPVYFPFIAAGQTASADVELTFPKRGRYVQSGFGLSTRFPFSFLVKTRRLPIAREIIVYPPVEATDELFGILPMISGEFESFVAGRGYDLYRIREYAPSDSARHLDWKATAKTGTLQVREFSREDERRLRFVFDNPGPGTIPAESYERGVTLTASLIWHFAQEHTQLEFVAPEYSGSPNLYDFFDYLAVVQPRAGASAVDHLPLGNVYNIIVTARRRGTLPTPLWESSYFVFLD